MGSSRLNLYVVDDDEAVRNSLGLLLVSRGHAVQTFASGAAFLASVDAQQCGCVILDLRMPEMSGLQVAHELRQRQSPLVIVFLSGHGDIDTALKAVKAGAFGWLEKSCSHERLLDEVTRALDRAADVGDAHRKWRSLTPRETEVARLVATGRSNKEIARSLVPECGKRAVETHRARVFDKLVVSNDNELRRFIEGHAL